ncbi:MAG: PDZ domain-containing protein [Firmicutes bacterium]|nr:PDZ domain-containing protein [Bacillota bacterium]
MRAEVQILVTDVAIGGPADKAGLQPPDVMTEVNGIKISKNQK